MEQVVLIDKSQCASTVVAGPDDGRRGGGGEKTKKKGVAPGPSLGRHAQCMSVELYTSGAERRKIRCSQPSPGSPTRDEVHPNVSRESGRLHLRAARTYEIAKGWVGPAAGATVRPDLGLHPDPPADYPARTVPNPARLRGTYGIGTAHLPTGTPPVAQGCHWY